MDKPKIAIAVTKNEEEQKENINRQDLIELSDNANNERIADMSAEESDRYIQNMEIRLAEQERQIRQLKLHATEMNLKNDQLLTAISEKDTFFTVIAHDLRNPLQALKGFIQILYEEHDSLTVNEISEITLHIKNSTTNFSDLLENLMLWARLQRGLTHFNQEVVPLLQVIRESVSLISDTASSRGIELSYIIPENLKVFADINILQTVIRNLISNAVKFTSSGGKISLSAKTADDVNVEITITDTGIGMSDAMIKDLFKLDPSTSRTGLGGEPGTGLGLIICKDFIENQGGRLWVESVESKGSIFHFTLPMTNNK
jgi:signal transduction histidine kinase